LFLNWENPVYSTEAVDVVRHHPCTGNGADVDDEEATVERERSTFLHWCFQGRAECTTCNVIALPIEVVVAYDVCPWCRSAINISPVAGSEKDMPGSVKNWLRGS